MLMMLTQTFTNGQSCNGNKWHTLRENTVAAAVFASAPLEFTDLNQDGTNILISS